MKKTILLLLSFFLLLTGCTIFRSNEEIPTAHFVSNGPVAVPPNAQGAEIWFENISHLQNNHTIPYRRSGGIWPNTKSNHSGIIDDKINWEEDEVLNIQLRESKYNGYVVIPVSIEQIGTEVLKITLQLKDTDQAGSKKAHPARVFIKVKKGALYQKRFYVVDEAGKTLRTN